MDDAINAAIERLDFVTRDKEFLRYYHMRRMAMSDQTTIINTAIEEGHAEKALEIAGKMKKAGRPLSEIVEFTGLPAETIEQL